ncbi:23S rRNA (pseudouridine(1915)-N(3))-methyltransferase RlmH, partial [Enterococcus lactis]
MNIKLVVVGKLKEKYFKAGIDEYSKRLSRFCKFRIIEVPDEKAPESLSESEMQDVMDKEGTRILDKIADKEYVYALAILGKERASEEFAKEIDKLATYGHSDIT